MDLLKDLRADLTLAPMQCCHSSTVHQRYIFLKSHFTYYDAILFFCLHLQNLNLYLNLKEKKNVN